jgi:hypothetical protein
MATKFFDLFPKVLYDASGTRTGQYDVLTNLTFRLGILRGVKDKALLYYTYQIQDGDTPEMIADKYYGDPTYHWVVLLMNDIVDPFYDWPLSYQNFVNYLVGKYGSVENSQETIARYERKITRRDSNSGVVTTTKMVIDETDYNSMAETTTNTYNLDHDNSTVTEIITRNIVYAYEAENESNEAKRTIVLLKKEYLPAIIDEFQNLSAQARNRIVPTVLTER